MARQRESSGATEARRCSRDAHAGTRSGRCGVKFGVKLSPSLPCGAAAAKPATVSRSCAPTPSSRLSCWPGSPTWLSSRLPRSHNVASLGRPRLGRFVNRLRLLCRDERRRISYDDGVDEIGLVRYLPSPHPSSFPLSGLLRFVSWAWSSSSPFPLRDAAVLSWVGSQSGFRPVVRHGSHVYVDVFLVAHILDVRVGRGEGNTWNDALNAVYHCETGGISRAFWSWNGCHSDLGDAPRRNDAGLHSADVDVVYVRLESAVGATLSAG